MRPGAKNECFRHSLVIEKPIAMSALKKKKGNPDDKNKRWPPPVEILIPLDSCTSMHVMGACMCVCDLLSCANMISRMCVLL